MTSSQCADCVVQAANSHKRFLESEVRTRRAAMDSFDQMNSSLISANIDLQVHDQCGHCHLTKACSVQRKLLTLFL